MKTVVIIEDEPEFCEILLILFERMGYYVLIYNDGESGLKSVEQEKPDLLILDLNLPKLSGEVICRTLKDSTNAELSQIPIIILTAKNTDADRIAIKAMGADVFMTKPVMLSNLMSEVSKFIPAAA